MPDTGATRRIVPLLAAAVFLNYLDRGTLATAGPLVQQELALDNAQMGLLFSAFFWSYAPLQPLAGWLAQRFDLRHVLAGGVVLWSLATALTGLAHGFWAILALRVLLGIGESVAYPCNAAFLGRHARPEERGRANGLIATGQSLGPLVGTLGGGLLIAEHGWRPAFLLFGLLSLLWLLPWWRATRDGLGPAAGTGAGTGPVDTAGAGGAAAAAASESTGAHAPTVPWRRLLGERSLWGTSLGHFCSNYAYYLTLTWLPTVLVRERGFTVAGMALVGSAVFAAQAVSAPLTGWLCDRALARGACPTRVLKRAMIAGLCGAAAAMAACAAAGPTLTVVLILLAGVFFGMQSAPLGSITQTLGGERAAGQWMGVQNLCANMAGVIAPVVTGVLVDRTGSFVAPFVLAAAVTAVGVFAYAVVVGRVEGVRWDA